MIQSQTEKSNLIVGDAETVLNCIGSNSIDCIITSPPYYGLRDYGIQGQIGLELSPQEYINRLVKTFRECNRILTKTGTLWLNIGDSYYNFRSGVGQKLARQSLASNDRDQPTICPRRGLKFEGIKDKDLIGIPWMLAFAMRADGWYLRQDIIWHKTNVMPESVKDRCTKSHEYLFLLTKSKKYYFDSDAIKQPANESSIKKVQQSNYENQMGSLRIPGKTNGNMKPILRGPEAEGNFFRNRRSVWSIPTRPFKNAHFATFPPDLIRPCVLAGCPEGGIVLDPFCGSGTTGLVALQNKRKFVGVDLKPEYISMAKSRIEAELSKLNKTTPVGV